MDRPTDVVQEANGFYSRAGQRVCEDCWQEMPRYVDFPQGLTSPESDGDAGGNFAKTRRMGVDGKDGREALRKAVCLPCYFAAFQRVYPGAGLPELCADTLALHVAPVIEPDAPLVSIAEPKA